MNIRISSSVQGVVLAALLGGCAAAPSGPPTGWIARDAALGTGTYVFPSGQRYVGQVRDDAFEGAGTLSWPALTDGRSGYREDYHFALAGMQVKGRFRGGELAAGQPISLSTARFSYEGGARGLAMAGRGVLAYADGVRIEGEFSHRPIHYMYYDKAREEFRVASDVLAGSHVSGPVRITWSDGAVFDGKLFDHYPIKRGQTCSPSEVLAVGTLHERGKAPYSGPVSSSEGRAIRMSEGSLKHFIGLEGECFARIDEDLASVIGGQRRHAEQAALARKEFERSLTRELAAVPAQRAAEMQRVQTAAMGSTPQLEADKARRDALLAEAAATGGSARAPSHALPGANSAHPGGASVQKDPTPAKPALKKWTRAWAFTGGGASKEQACADAQSKRQLPPLCSSVVSSEGCSCGEPARGVNGAMLVTCRIPVTLSCEGSDAPAETNGSHGPSSNTSR